MNRTRSHRPALAPPNRGQRSHARTRPDSEAHAEAPAPARPWRRAAASLAVIVAGFAAVSLLDRPLYHALLVDNPERVRTHEWFQMLRQVGYVPVYVVLAAAMTLVRLRRSRRRLPDLDILRPGLVLVCAVLLSGAAGEFLKLIVGRSRPLGSPDYSFRPFLHNFFDATNLGLPASHSVIAFAGAFALMRLFPGCGPVMIILALGCGLTRLLPGAHFASDVYAAAVVAYLVTAAVWAVDARITAWRHARAARPVMASMGAGGSAD